MAKASASRVKPFRKGVKKAEKRTLRKVKRVVKAAMHERGPPRKKRKLNNLVEARRQSAPVQFGEVRVTRQRVAPPTRITHRESLGAVTSTGTSFQVNQFLSVNPGLQASFPWLSALAANYETYKIVRQRYVYEPRCSTSTAGTVVMVTNYDASEGAFSSLVAAENYNGATVSQPWMKFSHALEIKSTRDYNRHYVRLNAPTTGTDIKTYDVGNFNLLLSGVPAGQIGELYVEYTYAFYDPKAVAANATAAEVAHIWVDGSATASNPLTGGVLSSTSTLNLTFNASGLLTFPAAGNYFIVINEADVDATLSAAGTVAGGVGVTNLNLFNGGTTNQINVLGENKDTSDVWGSFTVSTAGQTVNYNGATGMTGGSVDVFVFLLPPLFTLKKEKSVLEKKVDALISLAGLDKRFSNMCLDEKKSSAPAKSALLPEKKAVGPDEKSGVIAEPSGRLVRAPDDTDESYFSVSPVAAPAPVGLRKRSVVVPAQPAAK